MLMLVSLSRLNLTAANRIFIVELQWNPTVENQALARAIRINQSDKVLVTRYKIKETVEQVQYPEHSRTQEFTLTDISGNRITAVQEDSCCASGFR